MDTRKHSTSRSTDYFLGHPVSWAAALSKKPEDYWRRRGERMATGLFRRMKQRVPAYGAFLSAHGFRSRSVTESGFLRIPPVDKDSYLRKYPLPSLCWDGELSARQMTIAATSGSTGEPFYFPRTRVQDLQYAAVAEMYLRSNFSVHKRPTLYIVGWGMGVWIGGVFSYAAVRIVADRGNYPLSVITPGTSREEIIKAVRTLGPKYEQVIIGGYPPMIKDLIDEGLRQGMDWGAYHVKFIFSAEGFSEAFREYIIRHAGLTNPYLDTLNHYGTVDMGTMAHETPLSILIRRLAVKRPALNEALFGVPHRQPTFAQYIPELFYFEENNGRLLCTADSGLPMVRYDLVDNGGVKTLEEVKRICSEYGIDVRLEMERLGIAETIWNLPFVYVFERSDFTVKFSGANIFPEEIRRALEHHSISPFVTGKCTMQIGYDARMDQSLTIAVELRKSIKARPALESKICDRIVGELVMCNSEYAYLYRSLPEGRMTPRIQLVAYGNAPHFGSPGKHRWVHMAP